MVGAIILGIIALLVIVGLTILICVFEDFWAIVNKRLSGFVRERGECVR